MGKKYFTLSMCIKIGYRVNTLLWEKFKFKHTSTFYNSTPILSPYLTHFGINQKIYFMCNLLKDYWKIQQAKIIRIFLNFCQNWRQCQKLIFFLEKSNLYSLLDSNGITVYCRTCLYCINSIYFTYLCYWLWREFGNFLYMWNKVE